MHIQWMPEWMLDQVDPPINPKSSYHVHATANPTDMLVSIASLSVPVRVFRTQVCL